MIKKMRDQNHLVGIGGFPTDMAKAALHINGKEEYPTREEFFTNYPFYKYWKNGNNERLLASTGINIYIHIPFCIQICDYCFYMKELVKSTDQVNDYVDHLCKEIQMVSETCNLKDRRVNAVYIGGGTPSVLTEDQFRKVIDTLHRCHRMESPEFTFEAEPGTFNRTKLKWYKESGINRISMGVQSFDDGIIKLSSRKHSVKQAINSIEMIKEEGGFVVNIDLLSGLAGETPETWDKSLDIALQQKIDMLTIYKMKAYANTTFFKKGVHKQDIELPTAEQEVGFMQTALDRVMDHGYHRWSTFAFTRDVHLHRYAENTWRGNDMIAYGASSFGKIANISYQNLNNIQLYGDKVAAGEMPVYRSYAMTCKDMIVKELLLCAARLSSYRKSEFMEKFGFDYFNLIPGTIKELVDKGYITENTQELTLTRLGVLYGDFVGKVLASSVKEILGNDAIGFSY
jgi:oxygen-independent coproporphyrinogen III oxidase